MFKALGLRNGQLLVGATDVFRGTDWPEAGASLEDWVEALAAEHNDLEAPATRIQPVIGEVLAALSASNGAWLARMSGSGATCFAIYENTADAAARGAEDPARITRDGGCMRGGAELAALACCHPEARATALSRREQLERWADEAVLRRPSACGGRDSG